MRLTSTDLRVLAMMLDKGLADGYLEVEHEFEDDYGVLDIGYRRRRGTHERVTIDLQVDPKWRGISDAEVKYHDFAAPKMKICKCPDTSACPLHNWQHEDFGKTIFVEPKPDYQGAVNTLVNIIKAIQKAQKVEQNWDLFLRIVKCAVRVWTMDDSSKRFAALELD